MTKLEVLKTMLSDPEIMESYGITEDNISSVNLTPYHQNDMIAIIQHTINVADNPTNTVNTTAANLNNFLENRLRDNQDGN